MGISNYDLDVGDRIEFEGQPGEIERITLDDRLIAPVWIVLDGSRAEEMFVVRPDQLTVIEKTTRVPRA